MPLSGLGDVLTLETGAERMMREFHSCAAMLRRLRFPPRRLPGS
jgi:hypothetical protein